MYNSLKIFFQVILVLFFAHTSARCQEYSTFGDCKQDFLHVQNTTDPVKLFALPVSYSEASLRADSTAQLQIRNTLALYPFAIDGKNFAALHRVFTYDVIANYSAPLNVITGLSNLQSVLNASLFYVTTQHSFTTQAIDVLGEGCEAKSVTYFTATHFGQRDYYGQVSASGNNIHCMIIMWRIFCYASGVNH